jgi:translation initiation factor 3 subunit L
VFPIVQDLFASGCPKFVSPVVPDLTSGINVTLVRHPSPPLFLVLMAPQDPLKLQMKVFLIEVTQQVLIPFVRSYLKLYTTLPVAKLAAFLGMVCRCHVCCVVCVLVRLVSVSV